MRTSPVPSVLAEQGLCSRKDGPDFFSSDPVEIRRAVNWCHAGDKGKPCPVRFECLQWAVQGPETYGVWGGADQWEIRIACAVAPHGQPVKKARPAKCPYCRSTKYVTEVREVASRASQACCSRCGLTWRRAKSFVKKERARRAKPSEEDGAPELRGAA